VSDTAFLREELRICDYVMERNRQLHQNLLAQIDKYKDLDTLSKQELEQWKQKYELANDQIKQERRRKRVYQITTVAGFTLVVLLAL